MRHTFFLFFFVSIFQSNSFCQTINNTKSIDSIFAAFDSKTAPGYAVAVVGSNGIEYAKGFGMANLECNAGINTTTNFNLASASKQFTAYSILLLAEQGRLNLDDDIRKYLHWFPDLHQKITIRHLINHTSGIREQLRLLPIAGSTGSDYISQSRIIKILSNQRGLNFNPGEQYSYCNSGYLLLAEIIEKVSGQKFRAFQDSAIFKPLGMTHTFVHDEASEILTNYAVSYEKDDDKFYNYIYSNNTHGSTGLYSNLEDLGKWVMNFLSPKIGSANTINAFTTTGVFNNGLPNRYAAGIYVNQYRGQKVYWHSGADAGYRSMIVVFPELKKGIIVLANIEGANPWTKAYQVADLLFNNKLSPKQKPVPSQEPAIIPDNRLTGEYIAENGVRFSIWQKDGDLLCDVDGEEKLTRISKDVYAFGNDPDIKIRVEQIAKDSFILVANPDVSRLDRCRRYNIRKDLTSQQLQPFTGMYYCPELDCIYHIIIKDGRLFFKHNRYSDAGINLIDEREAVTTLGFMSSLQFTFSGEKVTGFEVNSGQVRHLPFVKVNEK